MKLPDLFTINVFADRRLQSELDAQKAANAKLHKQLKFQRDRANQLSVTVKTQKKRLTHLRKELREADWDAKRFALDVLNDSALQTKLYEEFGAEVGLIVLDENETEVHAGLIIPGQ